MTKYESWLTLLGFFGLIPVFVAKENFVTQLSNFFGAGLLPVGVGAYGIGFEVVTSRVIEARIALSRLSVRLAPDAPSRWMFDLC